MAITANYAIWTTAWGPMGGVYRGGNLSQLSRLILPHYQKQDLTDLLAWEHQDATQDAKPFELLIALTREYFNGQPVDFAQIDCKLPGEKTFTGKVLRACRSIQYSCTQSYGQLAERIGRGDSARAVAAALGKNPIPLVIPCHRVTYAHGAPGGFSAPGGQELKKRMLDLEQAASK